MNREEIYKAAKERFDALAKPIDGFGDFEDIICRIASVQGTVTPDISKRALVVMIADSRVTDEGVSQTDSCVTAKVARLLAGQRSTVAVMTKGYNVDLIPVDVGIDLDDKIEGLIDKRIARGGGNIAKECAMTEDQCRLALDAGIDIAKMCSKRGYGIIATGEMGIGNTTTATALLCALTGIGPADITGRGAGLSDEGLEIKTTVIEKALKLHKLNNTYKITPSQQYATDALRMVGGLDIAALSGVYIGAAMYRIPVIVDGLISAVAALAAEYIRPGTSGCMIASHTGRESGTAAALERLSLKAVLSAGMALGEGTGAVMLFPLLDMVMNVYDNGTRFSDTGIRQYERFEK